ncbi:MAG TPA: sugar transferase [Thermoleophilaceae bacterium]|nr:sugar transferase [Thermoleophilaceae bacterium]
MRSLPDMPVTSVSDGRTESAPAGENGHRATTATPLRPRREVRGDTRGYMLRRVLVVADVGALAAAFLLVELYGGLNGIPGRGILLDCALLALSAPVWIVLARAHNLYHVDTRRADHRTADEVAPVLQLTTLWSWSVLLLASATGLRSFSLPALVLFWGLTFVLLLAFRAVIRAWARRQPWYLQNALLVGTTAESAGIAARILRHPEYGINLVACIELSGDGVAPDAGVEGAEPVQRLGPVPLIRGDVEVAKLVDELDVDRVLLASSVGALGERVDLVCELSQLAIHLDVVPGWGEVMGSRLELHEMEGMPLLTFPPSTLPPSSFLLKRVLDVTVAAGVIAILSPLLAACAIGIKLDSPGPVLFRQCRVGRHGRRFELLKFRSMSHDAEALKEQTAHLNFHGGATEHGMFKVAEDPRVTRVGHLMRRLSLDELPQLFNVLRADMSLVGPRPLIESEYEQIQGRHRRRVDLLPGLTGLWQVHGRSDIPFESMVDLDYLYVSNWSMWMDLKLLIRTFAVVARGRGAY